ncbi:hypothetical protein HHL11_28035 [Ramlibacter sp. G-1-2-2]|uniref:DUF802 domain-containing protein n=1 Tax=Ramlibacter agri TaxID=2728837 RepID=A0A848HC15_9BURK|nr:hypothetical protein [Ramlibacter agri]NML47632.1 hypothetical protein [Ramlibacter agri]
MSKFSFVAAFAIGLALVAWIALGFVGGSWIPLLVTAVIAGAYLLGAYELQRFRATTQSLRSSLDKLAAAPADLGEWLAQVPANLRNAVRLRIEGERAALPGPALTPYLVGLLVMLGMLGTFLGMVVTFKGAVFALEGSTDLQAIRAALAEPIKGLGLSFGTSVAGVAASAMLGLMSTIARRERLEVARLLDGHIAGVLRPFSLVHQRQESFRALQVLPQLVETLDAMMARMEKRGEQLDAQLLERHSALQREVTGAYAGLADRVGASLQDNLASSAKAASEAIAPVMESAMAQVVGESRRLHDELRDGSRQLHEQLQDAARQTQEQLAAGARETNEQLLAGSRATNEQLQLASRESQEHLKTVSRETHQRLQDAARETLGQQDSLARETFEHLQAAARETSARMQAVADETNAQVQASASETHAQLQAAAKETREQVQAAARDTQQQLQDTARATQEQMLTGTRELQDRLGAIAREQVDALSQQFGASTEAASGHWTAALQPVTARLEAVLQEAETLARTRREGETRWLAEHGERMEQVSGQLREQLADLREDEARRGDAAVQRLATLEAAVAQHLATLGAALEAPITRLLQTASEVPEAAAGVITQLRTEMQRLTERDNAALDERTALLERLAGLLQVVQEATGEQRHAIDALLASASTVLEQAGERFAATLDAQTGQAAEASTQLAAGAVELASLGEAFGAGVQQFQAGNDKLVETLQRIEASLQRSTARSDEQLAYYVAQAREVIDLSIASQQGLVDNLRQLRTAATVEGEA